MTQHCCTVVIPAYNAVRHIEETVASVLASRGISIELVIVDDGSSDNTPSILSSIASSNRCVKIVRTANAGVSSARNTGLSLATFPFICFLDADDRLVADSLASLCHALELHAEAVAAYGDVQYIDEKSKRYAVSKRYSSDIYAKTVTLASLLQRNFIDTPGAILFRTDAIRQVGGFDPELIYAEDWELYVRVACLGPFVYCKKEVIDYRLHSLSVMNSKLLTYSDFEPALAKVFDTSAERYGISPETLKLCERRRRIAIERLIILKSQGLKTQLRNVRTILATLFRSKLDPVLIKTALKGILSAAVRVL